MLTDMSWEEEQCRAWSTAGTLGSSTDHLHVIVTTLWSTAWNCCGSKFGFLLWVWRGMAILLQFIARATLLDFPSEAEWSLLWLGLSVAKEDG